MTIEDYQSTAYNNEVKNDDIDKFIRVQGSGECNSLNEAMDKVYQSVKFIKKLKLNLENVKKDLENEESARIYAEKVRDQSIATTMKFQEFVEEIMVIFKYILKKLDWATSEDIELLDKLLLTNEFLKILDVETLNAIHELILRFDIPSKSDVLQIFRIENKDRSFKVASFLYDMIVILQYAGNTIVFSETLKSQLLDIFYA